MEYESTSSHQQTGIHPFAASLVTDFRAFPDETDNFDYFKNTEKGKALHSQLLQKFNYMNLKIDEDAIECLISNALIETSTNDLPSNPANDDDIVLDENTTISDKRVDVDYLMISSIFEKLQADKKLHTPGKWIDYDMMLAAIDNYFKDKSTARLFPFTKRFGDGIYIYDAFKDIADVYFDIPQQKFVKEILPKMNLKDLGFSVVTSDSTTKLYNRRFHQIVQRTRGHPQILFLDDAAASVPTESKTIISTVDSISFSSREMQHLIGFLKRDKDGDVCIQGLRMEVKLVFLDPCLISDGIYGEDHVVLVQGEIRDSSKRMYVTEMMHPPRDPQVEHNEKDIFGGSLSESDLVKLREYEWQVGVEMEVLLPHWVILSEVHLDNDDTILLLERMLNVYISQYPGQTLPTGFVFMGNFCSEAFNILHRQMYQDGFDKLYRLLTDKFRLIVTNCYLIFVPGPQDACVARATVPRLPLLPVFTNNFKERMETKFPECCGKIIFATNPCRIRHLTHKMIFFRNDVFNDLIWDSIKSGGLENSEMPNELSKTVKF